MKIKYFGHSAILIESDDANILFDPFITGNPWASNIKVSNIKADYILVSHGHGDHIGDTIEIAKNNNATVIAPYELAMFLSKHNINVHPMHIGGSFNFPFGKVKLTIATHGSAFIDDKNNIIYTGNPCGFLVTLEGKTFYFAGDTGLFYDMKLIGETNEIDYAFLPIGGNFTMDIDDAIIATKFLNPKNVIPIHYKTFDIIKAEPENFKNKLNDTNTNVLIIEPTKEVSI